MRGVVEKRVGMKEKTTTGWVSGSLTIWQFEYRQSIKVHELRRRAQDHSRVTKEVFLDISLSLLEQPELVSLGNGLELSDAQEVKWLFGVGHFVLEQGLELFLQPIGIDDDDNVHCARCQPEKEKQEGSGGKKDVGRCCTAYPRTLI